MYEYYTNYMGSKSYYVPEGYRGISHILLKVDQDLLSTYTSLAAELEEQKEKEEAPAEETEAPAEETETPAEETEAPAEETEAPAEETAEPAGSPEPTEGRSWTASRRRWMKFLPSTRQERPSVS